jgi:signal transduction histidine kinase
MIDPSPDAPPAIEPLEQFAANVAHDFNNLLTGMLGNLELMQNRAKRNNITTFDSYLEGARHAGNRAATFAQRLLAFSGRGGQDFAPVTMNNLLTEIVESMGPHAPPISVDLAAGNTQVSCDIAHAERAIHELLANAMDATNLTGHITLITRLSPGTVTIAIQDTGPGMPPDILARAKELFFTTKPNGAGKGLGLAIAERFARETHGTLEITSTPTQGTTASLHLPTIQG